MTDRSSQPCSSDDQSKTTITEKKGTRRFTVTLSKKSSKGHLKVESHEECNDNDVENSKKNTDKVAKQPANKDTERDTQKSTSSAQVLLKHNSQQKQPVIPKLIFSTKVNYPSSHKPAIVHAHFDPKRELIDPARPLTDIPEPAPRTFREPENIVDMFARFEQELSEDTSSDNLSKETSQEMANTIHRDSKHDLSGNDLTHEEMFFRNKNEHLKQLKQVESKKSKSYFDETTSKWELIQSPALTDHLALLNAGGLAKFPTSFYKNSSLQPLLSSIESMKLVDMSEIQASIDQVHAEFNQSKLNPNGAQYKKLGREGLFVENTQTNKLGNVQLNRLPAMDDIHNLDYASEWEAILYPQRFDTEPGLSNLTTDIMAVSVVRHALAQCPTRQSINEKLTAHDIAKYLRSFLLSQCNQFPHKKEHLKHVHIYAGHVIVVAKILGWQMQLLTEGEKAGEVVFNVSSRCGLFSRYPILSDYYVQGWE